MTGAGHRTTAGVGRAAALTSMIICHGARRVEGHASRQFGAESHRLLRNG